MTKWSSSDFIIGMLFTVATTESAAWARHVVANPEIKETTNKTTKKWRSA
jgi:hypothetical protein